MNDSVAELELKFRLDPSESDAIFDWLAQGGNPRVQTLNSIYFDTPARGLRKRGLVLRVRGDGRGWRQTIKSRTLVGGAFGRGEWECKVKSAAPDKAAAQSTPAGILLGPKAGLSPVFSVKVLRRSVLVNGPGGQVEASLDRGVVSRGERRDPFEELELELKSGAPATLFALARRLGETFDIALSFTTKADRGFAMTIRRSTAARRISIPVIAPTMSVGDAFRAIARSCLEHLAGNAEAWRQAPGAEAVHQMRVAVRRLRSALRTFGPCLSGPEVGQIDASLKDLAAALDTARNLDVFLAGAWARAKRPSTRLTARLRADRRAAYARAGLAIDSPVFRGLLLTVLVWIETGAWRAPDAARAARRDAPIAPFAAKALAKGRRGLLHQGRGIGRLDRDARHAVRIKAKRLRYSADVFEQIWATPDTRVHRFLPALKTLLDTLGALNDIATGEALVAAEPAILHAIIAERDREETLLDEAQKAWRALKRAKPFWSEKT